MAEKIPVKALFSGSVVTGLQEFESGDTIPSDFLGGGGNLAGVLAARGIGGGTQALTSGAFVTINWPTTEFEDDTLVLSHDPVTNNSRLTFIEAGNYLVYYALTLDPPIAVTTFDIRVIANGGGSPITAVVGSERSVIEDDDIASRTNDCSNVFMYTATAGDFIELQIQANQTGASVSETSNFGATRMRGSKGATGVPGSGSTIILEDESVSVPNTPHSTLNFEGTGVSVADGSPAGTVAVITIPSATQAQAQAYATSTQTLIGPTFTKLTGTTTFLSSADFDDDGGTAMAIRYIGAAPANVLVHYQARCASIDSSKAAMNFKLAVNGTVQDASQVSGQTDTNVTPDTASGNFILSLVQNDVIEMKGNRQSGAQDVDIFELVIIAVKL